MNERWSYSVVKEFQHTPELGQYLTYALQASRKTNQGWEAVATVHDISSEFPFVQAMAERFNRHQLSPLHLHDAIEDSL